MLLWETHNNVGSYYDIICGKVFFFFFSHLKAQCFNDTYPGLSWIDWHMGSIWARVYNG